MAITNTLKNAKHLQPAFSTPQAESLAEVLEVAVSNGVKESIQHMDEMEKRLSNQIESTNERISTLYWVVGFAVAAIAVMTQFG